MKTIFTLAMATALLAGYFSSYTPNAPQEPMPVFSMPDIKPRVHPWKTYHDRIEPEMIVYERLSRR